MGNRSHPLSGVVALQALAMTWQGSGRGGRPWRRKVERIKARDQYTCQECGRITEEGDVDHIKPLCEGGTDEDSNLQYLCRKPCHERKTLRESGNSEKVAIGLDGWPL